MGPRALLADGRYRRVWITGGFVGTMRWLEILVIGVYTLEATGSALQVALMMVARALPMFLFGSVTGAVAEQVNRKHLLVGALIGSVAVSGTLAALAFAGRIEIWHIATGAFLSGMLWTTEFPVRRTMLGEIAGPLRLGPAMGLDSATTNGTRMLGPALGGLLFETIGIQGAYLLAAVLYGLGVVLIVSLDYTPAAAAAREWNVFKTIGEGLRYVRSNRAIVGTLAVTAIMNLWGFPFAAMVPVIGRETLGLSAFPIGVLMSAEGAGALLGALVIAAAARPAQYPRALPLRLVPGDAGGDRLRAVGVVRAVARRSVRRRAGRRRFQRHADHDHVLAGAARDARPGDGRGVGVHRRRTARHAAHRPAGELAGRPGCGAHRRRRGLHRPRDRPRRLARNPPMKPAPQAASPEGPSFSRTCS